ncbi:class I SAM-dependent methyltransferase [Roseospira marina]|nr:class I SAM-dependent methyltransferase [Roseospira marina]MBB4313049.1 SAM-dependent methyltransferase [Roseospira marina]MBB5086210.1 SAM-dependent methyltransferase [Roseospira marina]
MSPPTLQSTLSALRLRLDIGSASRRMLGETRRVLEAVSHDDDRHTITHFSRLLSRHGRSHASLEWNSRESQQRRFLVLSEAGLRSGHSLLDVGCGTGDFVEWLNDHGYDLGYCGLDLTPAMVDHAAFRFPELTFVQGCLLATPPPVLPLPRFDWVVASGIFAHRRDDPETYMRAMIRAMLDRADRGVSVNSLSMNAPHANRWTLFHAEPEAARAWAESQDDVVRVVLREDYDPNDFSLYLYKTEDAVRDMTWTP